MSDFYFVEQIVYRGVYSFTFHNYTALCILACYHTSNNNKMIYPSGRPGAQWNVVFAVMPPITQQCFHPFHQLRRNSFY